MVSPSTPERVPFLTARSVWTVVLLVLALVSRVGTAAAQYPEDTLPNDSLLTDTVDQTARYLKALAEEDVRVPVLPPWSRGVLLH